MLTMLPYQIGCLMIIFISDGRLGNQIFQYAFLKTTANADEKIICFNMDQFSNSIAHDNSHLTCIPNSQMLNWLFTKPLRIFLNILSHIRLINSIKQLRSSKASLPSVSKKIGLLPITYIKTGFFQTEKLLDINNLDIRQKNNFIKKAHSILHNLPAGEKVFVHIRRGDYLQESYLGTKGINLPISYYDRAIKIIAEQTNNPFYIFLSDDPEFVRCCFKDVENKFISTESMLTDLALMSSCRYGVASNSSFSWWGSYFMKEKETVIFPNYWYGWKHKIQSHIGIHPSWGMTIEPEMKNKTP